METVRFGVIGYGTCGSAHAHAISRTPGSQLIAVAAPSLDRQHAARSAFPDCSVHADYRELLDHDDIDVVCVAVPNSLHFAIGTNVLRAGKHLLLEKPLALHAADADRLLALARNQRKILAVGHQYRVSPLWRSVRRLIEDGVIGRPLVAHMDLVRAPYRLGSEGWRYDPERVGSWLFEDVLHLFDLTRWYLGDRGEVLTVHALGNTRDPEHPELQDHFSTIIQFSEGVFAVVSQTLSAFGHHVDVQVAGTRGTLWASSNCLDPRDSQPEWRLCYGLGADLHHVPVERSGGDAGEYGEEIASIAECVRSNSAPPCGGEDGRWSTLLGLAARESATTGAAIMLAEFVGRSETSEL